MTAAELAKSIATGSPPVVLDVRSRAEFRQGHVPGATHIPFWRVAAHASALPPPGDRTVVVYCGHGPRASWAASALRRLGFRNVRLLAGHWTGWRRSGLPVERGRD
jgi:rhodanese-related sulfurtransferase